MLAGKQGRDDRASRGAPNDRADGVETYISGNIFFESAVSSRIGRFVDIFCEHHPLSSLFPLSAEDYAQDPLLYQPGGRDLARKDVLSLHRRPDQMPFGTSSASVMKSFIVEDLGATGANTQKRPYKDPLTTNKSLKMDYRLLTILQCQYI